MKYLTNAFFSAGIIFVLAFFLRLIYLTQIPPSLDWDEASLGVNAYSILKTGKDEWGRSWPLTFEAFGDYKLPGYIYTLVPFVAVFGLNEFSVRLPSVIFGSISVIFLYLIVFRLSGKKDWAVLSALLLAISPWHFFLSRIALEANLALSFFLIGLYFLIIGLNKNVLLILTSLFFGLSIFTYNSARIFVPLFLFSFIVLKFKKMKFNKTLFAAAAVFAIFISIGFYLAVFADSSARYYWVRILDEGAINYLEQSRNSSSFNPLITNLIYNKATYSVFSFATNYLKHLSVQFLALSGGSNYQFSLQGMGLIYLIELPFLIYGFFRLLKHKAGWIFLSWLLIAPIPSALTREAPHALRSIFMLGVVQTVIAFGFLKFIELIRHKKVFFKLFLGLIGFSVAFNAFIYFKAYFFEYPITYSFAWQYGYKQAVAEILENYDKYPKIYMTKKYGEPHIFYLFFSKYDMQKYQQNPSLMRYAKSNWRWVDNLDKIIFVNDWEMKEVLKNQKNALVITSPGNITETGKKLDTINFLDGSKAFEIFKI